MKINQITNIVLKGHKWKDCFNKYSKFFVQKNQPNYSIFALCASIGVLYDKQMDSVIDPNEKSSTEEEDLFYVPKSILDNHNADIHNLFVTAVLSSHLIDFSSEERLDLAFNPDCEIEFDYMNFLIKFANFGLNKLFELYDEETLTMMDNWVEFLNNVHNDTQSDLI